MYLVRNETQQHSIALKRAGQNPVSLLPLAKSKITSHLSDSVDYPRNGRDGTLRYATALNWDSTALFHETRIQLNGVEFHFCPSCRLWSESGRTPALAARAAPTMPRPSTWPRAPHYGRRWCEFPDCRTGQSRRGRRRNHRLHPREVRHGRHRLGRAGALHAQPLGSNEQGRHLRGPSRLRGVFARRVASSPPHPHAPFPTRKTKARSFLAAGLPLRTSGNSEPRTGITPTPWAPAG